MEINCYRFAIGICLSIFTLTALSAQDTATTFPVSSDSFNQQEQTNWSCKLNRDTKIRRPRGEWTENPTLKNWKLISRRKGDLYQQQVLQSNAAMIDVKTSCFNDSASEIIIANSGKDLLGRDSSVINDGVLVVDYEGREDWCLAREPVFSATISACPNGSQADHSSQTCKIPAQEERFVKISKPQAKLGLLSNSKKWVIEVKAGRDLFQKSSNTNKKAPANCDHLLESNPTFRYAVDYDGESDWCVESSPAKAASVTPMECPAPYSLSQ